MIGAPYFIWFEATQSAHRPQQLGEFSDAEIAARNIRAPRLGFARRFGAVVAERLFQKTKQLTVPTPARRAAVLALQE